MVLDDDTPLSRSSRIGPSSKRVYFKNSSLGYVKHFTSVGTLRPDVTVREIK